MPKCDFNKVALLRADFGQQDKFCDAEELKHLWSTTRILNELITVFSVLFNIIKTTLLKLYYNGDDSEGILTDEQRLEGERW